MGFAAYGTGPDFIYDNATPHGEPPETGPSVRDETFVMRQRHTVPWDPVSIRVKDGAIVATDTLAQRWTFPLEGPEAPQWVVRYFQNRGRYGGVAEHRAVTDAVGQTILSASEDQWNLDDFARLAEAAGLRLAPEALAPEYDEPPRRQDYVDFVPTRTPVWIGFPVLLLFLLLVPVSLIGLWDGYPWLWVALWAVSGTLFIRRQILDEPIIERNCAALPPDERPAEPQRKPNRVRSAAFFAALALVPPAVVHVLQTAPPLP